MAGRRPRPAGAASIRAGNEQRVVAQAASTSDRILRLTWLAMLQADDPSAGKASGRGKFSTRDFAAKHNLGDPVAVAWFNSHK